MPDRAIAACLDLAGADPTKVDTVAIVRPIPSNDIHLRLRAQFPASRIVVVEHHLAHAASAYYCSPFDEATVLTLDRGAMAARLRWQASGTSMTLDAEHCAGFHRRPLSRRDLLGFEANVD